MSLFNSGKVPWNSGGHWLIWLIALIIATIFIHNFVNHFSKYAN